jgi:hypothetical protein
MAKSKGCVFAIMWMLISCSGTSTTTTTTAPSSIASLSTSTTLSSSIASNGSTTSATAAATTTIDDSREVPVLVVSQLDADGSSWNINGLLAQGNSSDPIDVTPSKVDQAVEAKGAVVVKGHLYYLGASVDGKCPGRPILRDVGSVTPSDPAYASAIWADDDLYALMSCNGRNQISTLSGSSFVLDAKAWDGTSVRVWRESDLWISGTTASMGDAQHWEIFRLRGGSSVPLRLTCPRGVVSPDLPIVRDGSSVIALVHCILGSKSVLCVTDPLHGEYAVARNCTQSRVALGTLAIACHGYLAVNGVGTDLSLPVLEVRRISDLSLVWSSETAVRSMHFALTSGCV